MPSSYAADQPEFGRGPGVVGDRSRLPGRRTRPCVGEADRGEVRALRPVTLTDASMRSPGATRCSTTWLGEG